MNIVVSFVEKWGKDLFYPESEDAVFLTKFTGRPTLTKDQLKLSLERGWEVSVIQKRFNLSQYLEENKSKTKGRKNER